VRDFSTCIFKKHHMVLGAGPKDNSNNGVILSFAMMLREEFATAGIEVCVWKPCMKELVSIVPEKIEYRLAWIIGWLWPRIGASLIATREKRHVPGSEQM
jgi:hypothetical protein